LYSAYCTVATCCTTTVLVLLEYSKSTVLLRVHVPLRAATLLCRAGCIVRQHILSIKLLVSWRWWVFFSLAQCDRHRGHACTSLYYHSLRDQQVEIAKKRRYGIASGVLLSVTILGYFSFRTPFNKLPFLRMRWPDPPPTTAVRAAAFSINRSFMHSTQSSTFSFHSSTSTTIKGIHRLLVRSPKNYSNSRLPQLHNLKYSLISWCSTTKPLSKSSPSSIRLTRATSSRHQTWQHQDRPWP
jgi:hypothetical protein